MNFQDWYTDLVDVYREVAVADGNLTRKQRQQVGEGIPCRLYHDSSRAISMDQTAARVQEEDTLQCGNEADIRAGDELRIHRGGRLGNPGPTIRAFAGEPRQYYEPFGAVLPGLAHQEIRLLQQERVK